MLKRENRDAKGPPKPPTRIPTVSVTETESKPPTSSSENGGICKSKRYKLQQCPVIKKCEHVSIRRQYAAAYGLCFNCGLERPGHGSSSCPEAPECSKCPTRHLSLLHTESNQNVCCPNSQHNRVPNDKHANLQFSQEHILLRMMEKHYSKCW